MSRVKEKMDKSLRGLMKLRGLKKKKKNEEEEDDPEEDVPEEEMPTIPRPTDEDADKDYLQYLKELQRHPKCSPIHSSQVFAQHLSDDSQSQSSDAHSQPSYDLSGV
ncbi:hypothetical protein PIB30_080586 [Stylosanthes scabra]|uniref:Uncharacterized protein n=1 Tax=Stylosanthes scabra TaxID=79078 RepID=A0ABU6XQZ2_9FABA|nr:hypothetical protein [Stylosanthes scabra]